jgi:2-polyprenyl-6-hydroxyphenyl methylase/3-demethylubiquinone-9 3-methyltransferase
LQEVTRGERFEFGKNWSDFLRSLDGSSIIAAEESLKNMLDKNSLTGQRFLDAGSGSGLFSLAARRLGASVHSFDYDPKSVRCTAELRRRFFPDDGLWDVEEGSVLDSEYLTSIGQFDVVYAWGVLHHTGDMWVGLENVARTVAPGGKLFIAIYNDTGTQAKRWRWIKRTYNRLPKMLRIPFAAAVMSPSEAKRALRMFWSASPGGYIRSWTRYRERRGMSRWHDIIDWVGGYPYEVATPEQIFDFYRARGFILTKLKCGGVGLGCNEFVFLRERQEV